MSRFAHPDLCQLTPKELERSRNYQMEPYPPQTRVFADFTGAGRNPSEMARIEEERYADTAPEAGSVPVTITIVAYPVSDEMDRALANSSELIRQVVGVPEKKAPANDDGPVAIGLSGFAQTGKTTVANYIESKYGYRRQHIAEPLRDMLRTLLRRFGLEDALIDRYLTGDLKEEFIPCLKATSRRAQITLGTEWGRELIDNDLWARLWSYEAEAGGGKAMNDSVRFSNEEAAIQGALGGFTIMVERPGTEPVAYKWGKFGRFLYRAFGLMWGVHDSERVDRLHPDHVIVNDGTLEELYAKIDEIFAEEEAMRCAA